MPSIYKPKRKNHWYISFIDPDTNKTKTISSGFLATELNRKKVEKMSDEIEKFIQEKVGLYKNLHIKKDSIQTAFQKFKEINYDKHPHTKYAYDTSFKKFSEFTDVTQPCTVINKNIVEEWLLVIKRLPLQKNSVHNIYKFFNKFLNFLFEYNYIPVFKINKDIRPKMEVKRIITFKDEDLSKIINSLESEEKNSNFKTMIYLLTFTGLRPSDIIDLTAESFDLENMTLQYYSKKTDEHFLVPVSNKLRKVLQDRVEEVKSGKLFNYKSYSEMGRAFRRYIQKIGLKDKEYNLRTFRKTFATRSFENNIQPATVAKLLGHRSINTTMKYYTRTERKKLKEDLEKLDYEFLERKNG